MKVMAPILDREMDRQIDNRKRDKNHNEIPSSMKWF